DGVLANGSVYQAASQLSLDLMPGGIGASGPLNIGDIVVYSRTDGGASDLMPELFVDVGPDKFHEHTHAFNPFHASGRNIVSRAEPARYVELWLRGAFDLAEVEVESQATSAISERAVNLARAMPATQSSTVEQWFDSSARAAVDGAIRGDQFTLTRYENRPW